MEKGREGARKPLGAMETERPWNQRDRGIREPITQAEKDRLLKPILPVATDTKRQTPSPCPHLAQNLPSLTLWRHIHYSTSPAPLPQPQVPLLPYRSRPPLAQRRPSLRPPPKAISATAPSGNTRLTSLPTPVNLPPPPPLLGPVKLLFAIIRPEKLDAVKDALVACGINGITVSQVTGFGKQLGHTEVYRGIKVEARFLPKIMLTLLVGEEAVAAVMAAIRESASTGEIGDGKIVVLAVEEAMRIRTGETGEASLD